MRRLVFPLLLAAVAAGSRPAAAQDDPGARPAAGERILAIVGGEVHDGKGGVFRRGTVLCRGSKIIGVGSGLEVPEGARVIDAKGRWVLPGLVAPRGNNFGIRLSTRRRPRPATGERFADNLDPESRNLELALAAGITAYYGEGQRRGIYGYTNAVIKTAHRHPDLMVMKEPAALSVAWANAQATDRDGFVRLLGAAERFIEGGKKGRAPATSAVIEALERKIPVRVSAVRKRDIAKALELAERFDFRLVLTNCHEAWTLAKEIAAAGATPVMVPRQRLWPSAGQERSSGSSIEACARLEKAGVRFCVLPPGGFGSAGHGIGLGGISGRDLLTYPLDAGFAVRGGASTDASLRAITLTAAEALGVDERIGSLERGKDADIVIFQGDPMDYRNLAEVTIVSGRVVYERAKSSFFRHLKDPQKTETER